MSRYTPQPSPVPSIRPPRRGGAARWGFVAIVIGSLAWLLFGGAIAWWLGL